MYILQNETMTFNQRFRLNLIQEAKTELDFLALVDDFPSLYAGPVLKNAIRRYEMFWLPLAAREGSSSRLLAAPLDIAWVWYLHMLSPEDYEQDCMNIVSQVVDHLPMNRYQRERGLQNARYLWQNAYPTEWFEVDLNYPTPFTMPYGLKIRYDIEKASYNQSKFYYQVSLPHFSDSKFLESAVERYEHHLHLKSQNPQVPMVPCTDMDLIWHAHLHHPLNYKEVTSEIFGSVVYPGIYDSSLSLGLTLDDSETGTSAVSSAAGFKYDKAGTVYRGEPPQPRPSRQNGLYSSLGRLRYVMRILQVELVNVDVNKKFAVRIYDPMGGVIVDVTIQGGVRLNLMSQCIIDNENRHTLSVSLHQKSLLGFERSIGSSGLNLLSFMDAYTYGGIPQQPWVIDVPFAAAQAIVRLSAMLDPPSIEGYRFTVQPDPYFANVNHPCFVLSFAQSMFLPKDFAKTYLPCECATHTLLDCRGREAFKCRVVHSIESLLSAVEIISVHGVVVASAHTMDLNALPEKAAIEDYTRCAYLNRVEGERAMVIKGQKDWGICIGKWQRGKMFNRSAGQVEIKFFKLNGLRGWCEVRKFKGGLYLVYLEPAVFVFVDLKRGLFVFSPSAQDVPEIVAFAFSMSILYLLCKPYNPTAANVSSPSFHKKVRKDKVTTMLLAAGYKSSVVPTNIYLSRSIKGFSATDRSLEGAGTYDLDSESGPDWIRELMKKKPGALLWYNMSGVPYEIPTKNERSSRGSFFFGSGGGGGGDGGGGGGGDGGGGC